MIRQFVAVLACSFALFAPSFSALAVPADAPLAALEQQAVPAGYVPAKQVIDQQQRLLQQLVAAPRAVAGSPVPPAAVAAPAPQAEVAPAPGGLSLGDLATAGGILAVLGTLLTVVFKVWTGARSSAVRQAIVEAARSSWYIAEAVGGDGAKKYQAAVDAFLGALNDRGIKPTDAELAARDYEYAALSAQDKVARARIASATAATPADPSKALAAQ